MTSQINGILITLLIIFICCFDSAQAVYKWKVPEKYNNLKKAFIQKDSELTIDEIKAFLYAVFKMSVKDDDEQSLMIYLASKYRQQAFPDDNQVYNGKDVVQYFRAELLQDFVEVETRKIYNKLIEYYEIEEFMDEKMYKWIADGKSTLFGFTLDAYFLSIEDVNKLLEVSETECESEAEDALANLYKEFNDFKPDSGEQQQKEQQQQQMNNENNSSQNNGEQNSQGNEQLQQNDQNKSDSDKEQKQKIEL